jgi:predicted nuclease of predicted toxin-antitoxin system
MKGFLFDENLPANNKVSARLPVLHTSLIGSHPTDTEIWEFARRNELVIVSKDPDFSQRIILSQPPPWVVHLRFGNLRKKEYHDFLAKVWPLIERLITEHKVLNVHLDQIEGIGEPN